MKRNKKEKKYICLSEDVKLTKALRELNYIPRGFLGDIHTIPEWVDIIYGEKAKGYFETDAEALEYLRKYTGKRLEEVK